MKRLFSLFIISFWINSIFAQGFNFNQGNIEQKNYLQIISYQNINGFLVVPVSINGKTYNFLLDTGAPLMISYNLFKELNLPIISQMQMTDASGKKEEMKIISLPELHLQEITFINTPGIVGHEESSDYFNLLECFGIDGIIGSNMLRNSIIQFDEHNKYIIITNNIKKLSLRKTYYQKIGLDSKQCNPFITIILHQKGRKKTGDNVLFDTGDSRSFYSMSIAAYDWLNERLDIVKKIAESDGSHAWSAHGSDEKQRHLLLKIPELKVNKAIFSDVVIMTNNSQSRVGAKLLNYGKVTLDYKKKRFYFEVFDSINTNELSEKPWSILPTLQNNKYVIGIIWDKALETQINLGDEILNVNGVDTQLLGPCDLLKLNFENLLKEKRILKIRDMKTEKIKTLEITRFQQIE